MVVPIPMCLSSPRILDRSRIHFSVLFHTFSFKPILGFFFCSFYSAHLCFHCSFLWPHVFWKELRLTPKTEHNKNNNNRKAICCLRGLALSKKIYAFMMTVLAMGLKCLIWNSKLCCFLVLSCLCTSFEKWLLPFHWEDSRGAIRKNKELEDENAVCAWMCVCAHRHTQSHKFLILNHN